MDIVTLTCESRKTANKGESRRLRLTGQAPGVVYGKGSEPTSIAFNAKALTEALKGPLKINTPLTLKIGNVEKLALLQDYQKHPTKHSLTHADFLQIDANKPVRVKVPVHEVGKSKGVVDGGVLTHIRRALLVEVLPSKIPAHIEADITELGLGKSMHASQVTLPEGVILADDPKATIFVVSIPRAEEVKAVVAEVAEGAAPAEGAAAAAGGAAPAEGAKAGEKAPAEKAEGKKDKK